LTAIFTPANWIDPLDWGDVFGNDRPVEIDIGCGKGAFLVCAAQSRPHHNFVGIERQCHRLRQVDRKIQRANLSNVRLLRVEASYFVAKLVADTSVAVYHILFPDPWPKRRHQRRRLFQPTFVAELYRTLQLGGVVNVATDDADYAVQVEKMMSESDKFSATMVDPFPTQPMTEFETIFVAAGKKIFRARFVRR
jgi:tRNA (guanine-N7-)-methyltransferase